MTYTLKLSFDSRHRNAAYKSGSEPFIGTARTIAEARKMARDYGDPRAGFVLYKGGELNRCLRADGTDL